MFLFCFSCKMTALQARSHELYARNDGNIDKECNRLNIYMMSLAKLKTFLILVIAFVNTLKQRCTLPEAGLKKTTSQAFRPQAEEKKGLALSLTEKPA